MQNSKTVYSTEAINKTRFEPTADEQVWVFGYGSLIHRVDFDYEQETYALVTGWQRRFWMKSEDHRGTPESPGRVLTLVRSDQARCVGRAFLISRRTLHELDYREQNGYLRHQVSFQILDDTSQANKRIINNAIVFMGDPSSPVYAPEPDLGSLAKIIAFSKGPSGPNSDYVYGLHAALQSLKHDFPHYKEIIDDPELNMLYKLIKRY